MEALLVIVAFAAGFWSSHFIIRVGIALSVLDGKVQIADGAKIRQGYAWAFAELLRRS